MMKDNQKKPSPHRAGLEKNLQALSSRIPPVRAVAVTSNLYKPHACLPSQCSFEGSSLPKFLLDGHCWNSLFKSIDCDLSVRVVKRPDMFGFRNPGLMRVPPSLAVLGGNSDCRNRRLQTMFQLVGYGDHAGSGIPKIYRNWEGQHWRRPLLYEQAEPEQTLMELRMTSHVPAEALAELESHLGRRFKALPVLERLALVTVAAEGVVHHARLREISTEHPADITKMLAHLVKDGLLAPDGIGRGMVYFLPWQARGDVAIFATERSDRTDLESGQGKPLTQELGVLTQERGSLPREFESPLLVEVADVPPDEMRLLESLAQPARSHKRVSPDVMRGVVLQLCMGRYLGIRVLAHLLRRDSSDLARRILTPLVGKGELLRAYPRPNDPRQAYISNPQASTGPSEDQE